MLVNTCLCISYLYFFINRDLFLKIHLHPLPDLFRLGRFRLGLLPLPLRPDPLRPDLLRPDDFGLLLDLVRPDLGGGAPYNANGSSVVSISWKGSANRIGTSTSSSSPEII